ncbi:hypothetical protein ACHAW5_010195 [Stephanodiscus triporus]|uniref:Uncharacterized protein n=1 Tax=Stephanodiscus triporus TaxID=2934178 RepID=A0ABD3PML3_9STRA
MASSQIQMDSLRYRILISPLNTKNSTLLRPYNGGNFAFYTDGVLFVGVNQVGGGIVGDEASRVDGNYKWVKYNMDTHLSRGMRAIVVFAHASMGSARQTYFGAPFMSLLKTNAYSNLTSVQVDAGQFANPIIISVLHDTVADDFSLILIDEGSLQWRLPGRKYR